MLVATAGHIDHGKTSLIRALTGVETDRLPEERARGISIDLGFAYWRPDDGKTIGFIDVPGHERFVRNMLAGVGGIDFALLIVAADDGVMPQSVEHVQILDLLGVGRGAVAITKCDRSSPERIMEVRGQVEALLGPTALAGAPMFDVSSATGAGVADLAEALRAARRAQTPRHAEGRNFRLAIDRAFSVTGVGTVAAGTVLDGAVETGARLVLSPRGLEARVRGLQSGGKAVNRVQAGERCALNLAGVDLSQVGRGDWLVAPAMHAPTSRLEVRLKVLRDRDQALKHHTPLHLHIGTADIGARVLIAAQASIAPGGEAVVQLQLDHPTSAATGDRFVVRDQSGRHSIGGGVVIDPFVTGKRRPAAARAPISAALQQQGAAHALAALLAIPGHEVDTRHFERCFNLEPATAHELYRQADAVLLGNQGALALPAPRVAAVQSEVLTILKAYHAAHPDEPGLTQRDLRAKLAEPVSERAFLAIQKDMNEKRLTESTGVIVRAAGHAGGASPGDDALWRKVRPWLEDRGLAPFTQRDLTAELRVNDVIVRAMLNRRRRSGEIWRITEERFLLREQVADLAASAAQLARKVGGDGFSAAQYRDAIGIGRNLTIQILEFLDALGVTQRSGDLRRMRPGYERVVGGADAEADETAST
ncbi:MAG TPA: selenocysteine-specific translation elongation factor [Caulobacteraceae bacterium]|nr:selenocysteine-specific translation elongation factor [Caulobacteraceae bacterium]